jgi:hypothetical protein
MEILLIITIIAVAAAALLVALTFDSRTKRAFAPLMNTTTENINEKIEAASGKLQAITTELGQDGELQQHMQAITDELQRNRRVISQLKTANGELQQHMQTITDELQRNREAIQQLGGQVERRGSQLGGDLARLDYRVAELGESVAQQNTRIARIYNYATHQEIQASGRAGSDSLLLAMLEAESHVDGKGWGGPPQLYALTRRPATVTADHDLAAGTGDARPDELVPADQQPLPDGDLIDALAGIHWPEDVVGCVLVAELTALTPRNEENTPFDPVAADQWASTHPDGRRARLIIGVARTGEHECGLRVKGEDDIQVRTEMADDLVNALLSTF